MDTTYSFPFLVNEQKFGDQVFLRQPFGTEWETYTWKEAGQMARKLASGLLSLGLPPKSHIGIISKNCREWIIADLAIMMAGYVSVPLYANLGADQLAEVLDLGDVKATFVGKVDTWSNMKDGIPADMPVIAFPDYDGYEAVDRGHAWFDFIAAHEPLQEPAKPALSDIWTIVFTSGTTGTPKGVVLTYEALDSTSCLIEENNVLNVSKEGDNRFFSFLPLNHIAERVVVEVSAIMFGGSISFSETLATFAQNLRDTQPTVFFAVPRIWTKFQLGILSKLPQEKLDMLLSNPASAEATAKQLRQSLGLDGGCGCLTGAAPMPETVKEWFKRIGVLIHEGYGMTENCAVTTLLNAHDSKPGSVGKAQPRADIKIDADTGEILMRAPYMMQGYYKDAEKTAEVIRDGWLHTGDEGRLDDDGYLYITGRVKDTFKTAKGQFIVPAPIEWDFSVNTDIEQICVMGIGCPQPIALVNLSDIGKSKPPEEVEKSLSHTLSAVNAARPNYQRISTIVVSQTPWTPENDLITPTLKVKRNKLHDRYKAHFGEWDASPEQVVWAK